MFTILIKLYLLLAYFIVNRGIVKYKKDYSSLIEITIERDYNKNKVFNKKEKTVNHVLRISLSALSVLFLMNMTSEETTVEGHKRQKVNFYGTLTTQQDEVIPVNNIAVAGKYKQIILYEYVAPKNSSPEHKNVLTADPKEGIITKIDLAEVSEIRVPSHHVVWVYQKRKAQRKAEYVEIIIISGDTQKTENHYFIDIHRKITCEQSNAAGPIEKEVPIQALKSLKIDGYCYRDEKEKPTTCSAVQSCKVNTTACTQQLPNTSTKPVAACPCDKL